MAFIKSEIYTQIARFFQCNAIINIFRDKIKDTHRSSTSERREGQIMILKARPSWCAFKSPDLPTNSNLILTSVESSKYAPRGYIE